MCPNEEAEQKEEVFQNGWLFVVGRLLTDRKLDFTDRKLDFAGD